MPLPITPSKTLNNLSELIQRVLTADNDLNASTVERIPDLWILKNESENNLTLSSPTMRGLLT